MIAFKWTLRVLVLFVVVFQFNEQASAKAAPKEVNIAFQTTFSPWANAMATQEFEKQTGYTINWRKFNSGADVMAAMASNSVDIGVLGSSPLSVAVSMGMDIKLFWILEDIAAAESLMVRNGANIHKPDDLIGKTIAVPTASTSHFQLIYVLQKWGIADKVKVINLNPEQAAASWELGNIDGAFIWGPALSRISKTGHPLVSSGDICKMGRCTFEGLAVTGKFASQHESFLKQFVQIINATNHDFRQRPQAWAIDSTAIQNVAKTLGGSPSDVFETIALYQYPSAQMQATCEWLGCKERSGAAKVLKYTAEFLKEHRKIDRVLPDYSLAVTADFLQ